MTYEYYCQGCKATFDVIKPHTQMLDVALCACCHSPQTTRIPFPRRLQLHRTAVKHAEYNPAFGMVVKNDRHKDYLCKSKDLVEIGNDFKSGQSMQHDYMKSRETKRKQAWDNL